MVSAEAKVPFPEATDPDPVNSSAGIIFKVQDPLYSYYQLSFYPEQNIIKLYKVLDANKTLLATYNYPIPIRYEQFYTLTAEATTSPSSRRELLFYDSFMTSSSLDSWSTITGTTTIESSSLKVGIGSGTEGLSAVEPISNTNYWTDYIIWAQISVLQVGTTAGFVFRTNFDSNNYYKLEVDYTQQEARIKKYTGGVSTTLGTASLPFTIYTDVAYNWLLVADRDTLSFYLDGLDVLSVIDPSYFTSGGVGIFTDTNFVYVPDLEITQLHDLGVSLVTKKDYTDFRFIVDTRYLGYDIWIIDDSLYTPMRQDLRLFLDRDFLGELIDEMSYISGTVGLVSYPRGEFNSIEVIPFPVEKEEIGPTVYSTTTTTTTSSSTTSSSSSSSSISTSSSCSSSSTSSSSSSTRTSSSCTSSSSSSSSSVSSSSSFSTITPPVGYWWVTSDLNTIRRSLGGAGTQTAGISFGGYDNSNLSAATEKYDGQFWTTDTDLNTARQYLGGLGFQSAALSFGGADIAVSAITEDYNGTVWTNVGGLNTARRQLAGAGTTAVGLSFGGWVSDYCATTEEYNSGIWAASNDLNHARQSLAGCGTQSAALSIGGTMIDGPVGVTEDYNGTVWLESNQLNDVRQSLAGCGTQALGLSFGGANYGNVGTTEEYDGTSWSIVGSLCTVRKNLGGCGTQALGLCFGGYTTENVGATEEYYHQ